MSPAESTPTPPPPPPAACCFATTVFLSSTRLSTLDFKFNQAVAAAAVAVPSGPTPSSARAASTSFCVLAPPGKEGEATSRTYWPRAKTFFWGSFPWYFRDEVQGTPAFSCTPAGSSRSPSSAPPRVRGKAAPPESFRRRASISAASFRVAASSSSCLLERRIKIDRACLRSFSAFTL